MNLERVLRIILSLLVAVVCLGLILLVLGLGLVWWLYRWVMNRLTGRPMPLMGLKQWQEKARQHGAWTGFTARPGAGGPGGFQRQAAQDDDIVDVQVREVTPTDRQLR